MALNEGDLLWKPSPAVIDQANLTHYMAWLQENYDFSFDDYQNLWRWSVTDIEQFWATIWAYFDVTASQPYHTVLAERTMPGAEWFVGAKLNYAENVFKNMTDDRPALLYQSETEPLTEMSWPELQRQTRIMAEALKQRGVERGDRVVAYLPHIPEAVVGLLACASLGAIWSSCAPDFGSRSVLDRFSQIEPKVLLAVDGYTWNGKTFERYDTVAELQAELPTLQHTILVTKISDGGGSERLQNITLWDDLLADNIEPPPLEFEQVPFDHPLWVLYSSGTTGLPKPIVQGQGGIILEHLKSLRLTLDLSPGDRFFWYTSTGWMMWNFLVGGLLNGNTIIIYNGSPAYPSLNVLWELAEKTNMNYFGTAAAFISGCLKAGLQPNQQFDLSQLDAVGSTGSPLSLAGFGWIYKNINQTLALESFSGGTDLCTGFVGGCRIQPIYAGEIQAPSLGAKVLAYNEEGQPVIDQVGELVIAEPMPSMPLYFWNDPDNRRYRDSYFEMFPGVWRHGDWIKFNERGGSVIYGRSDSTINRQGVRMGTSEIYQSVESLPEVLESLVIDLEALGQESYMPLFVVLRQGYSLDDALEQRIRQKIRAEISPRHVPSEIFEVTQIPYTLSGKRMEVPIRKILLGQPVQKAANPGAMRNPDSLQFFVDLAQKLQAASK